VQCVQSICKDELVVEPQEAFKGLVTAHEAFFFRCENMLLHKGYIDVHTLSELIRTQSGVFIA